ncbi:hypothetical protein MMC16_003000 [Acarospora aff. strigata]|nr:hypothetical protein [Acarospora aff. strigata]
MSTFQQLQALYRLPIYTLPPELVLNILNMLTVAEFSSFTFAAFHLMRRHGIAPAFSTERIVTLLSPPPPRGLAASGGLLRNLPTELVLDLMQELNITDTINFLFANLQLLRDRNIAPWPLSGGSAQICRAYPHCQLDDAPDERILMGTKLGDCPQEPS